jgi:sulfide dehydrogenase [flavocytochrome c] flavoprotein chain
MNRRDLIKFGAVTAAVGAISGCTSAEAKPEATTTKKSIFTHSDAKADVPMGLKGPKIVIVGGGVSGLTIAKHIKKLQPTANVVVVEKRQVFISGFISNLYLVGLADYNFITHSYIEAAQKNNYTYLNAAVNDVDRESRTVHTSEGTISYDYLVMAPGIDYNHDSITGGDTENATQIRQNASAAFIQGAETMALKNRVEYFEEGNFVLTVPAGNYRCLPGPYERAALLAWYFKKEEIPGKIILLDENPDITIKKAGFHAAFDEYYSDVLEYYPSSEITKVDTEKKIITTPFETINYSEAAIYPRIRGAKILERIGVATDGPTKEGNIDAFNNICLNDDRVYVTGDARNQGFSKSGNTANSEGQRIARDISARIDGKELDWKSPLTVCYSLVNGDPMEGISVVAEYEYNKKNEAFGFTNVKMQNDRDKLAGKADLEWARGIYRDLFTAL